MEQPPSRMTVAEYFAGIGLVRMGLEAAGWRIVFANDISPQKHQMYRAFFPDAEQHYVIKDVFDLDSAEIPTSMLATCSFPCIDLSLAGNQNGIDGKHSSAFWGFTKALKAQEELAPPLVLVENVPGWLYSNKGADFRTAVQALNDLGYTCDVFTLDALRFTPQSRLRVFLVGVKDRTSEPIGRRIFHRPRSLWPDNLKQALFANDDLAWFYANIPEPPPLRTSGLADIVEIMDEEDSRWWSEEETQRHLAMMEESHARRVDLLARNEHFSYRTFFRRRRKGQQRVEVRDDDIAGCLRTAVGGSGKQFLIRAGQGQIRMRTMTPREYARLQGVPDSYAIGAEGVQAYTGFGDAVCVPVITWIAQNVLNPLVKRHVLQAQASQVESHA